MILTEVNDKEVLRARLRLLDLLKSFFGSEPDAEMLSRWRGFFAALVKEPIASEFDGAAMEICRLLNGMSLAAIQNQYVSLFIASVGGGRVALMASPYLDGRKCGTTLARVRNLMRQAGFALRQGEGLSEDALTVLLDFFSLMVEEGPQRPGMREVQRQLLEEILLPFSRQLSLVMDEKDRDGFYGACSHLLCGYLALECELAASAVSPAR